MWLSRTQVGLYCLHLDQEGTISKARPDAFLAAAIVSIDSEEALDWAEDLPQGLQRQIAINEVCLGIAAEAPRAAADLASSRLPAESEFEDTFAEIDVQWAVQEPLEAADWAARFPVGTMRTKSLASVIRVWDPVQAEAWASSLPESPLRSEVLSLLASSQASPTPPD